MFGKIYTSNLNTLKKHKDLVESSEVLLITQGGKDVENMVRFRKLAPSTELFHWMLNAKLTDDKWFDKYSIKFIAEMLSPNSQDGFEQVISALEAGLDVILVCYCTDFNICHRSLVANMFENKEFKVIELT